MASGVVVALAACEQRAPVDARYTEVSAGSAARGRQLLEHYQCGSCHVIPEVRGAAGPTAPSLAGFGRRSYIAGELPNGPATLTAWIESPQALLPGTTMPDMGASRADARDMAAYLLTLR